MGSTTQMPVWLQILQATSLIAIAVVGATIAWRQYLTAAAKFRLDLYDRRMKVYNELRKLLSHVAAHANVNEEVIRNYTIAVSDAEFLFDQKIAGYLDNIRMDAIKLAFKTAVMEDTHGDARKSVVQDKWDQIKKLTGDMDNINNVFRPYLQIEEPSYSRPLIEHFMGRSAIKQLHHFTARVRILQPSNLLSRERQVETPVSNDKEG